MTKDPVVEEVRRIREQLAAKYEFDLDAILAAAKKRQSRSGSKTASFATKPKRTQTVSNR